MCIYIYSTVNSLYFLSLIRAQTELKILYISIFCIENTSFYLF